jgi:type II secretory pathway predicted ATPase ExeA
MLVRAQSRGEWLTMYQTHFGLHQRPFRATPDLEGYYPATTHERALARLLQAVADDEGLAVLVGEPGAGKTLVCHRLLERLGDETTSALITNSHIQDRIGLFQAILYDLSLPFEGRTEQELRLTLTDFLLKNYRAGRRAVLIVDEAHHLSVDLVEELRLLGNLEAGTGKAFQVILAGLPSLLETLRRPELASSNQRIAVRVRLEPLGVHEAADYLLHQLRAAGGRPEAVISDEAIEVLARGTHGLPRLLNQAAHAALTLAHQEEAGSVDAEAALDALAVLGLAAEAGPDSPQDLPGGMDVDGDLADGGLLAEPGVAERGEAPEDDDRPDPPPTAKFPPPGGGPHRLFPHSRRPA